MKWKKPADSQDLKKEDDLISTTEKEDNDIQKTNDDENVDNLDTTGSNDEVKVGIFITEDIEDLDEDESSLPVEVSDRTGEEADSGTEVDSPESNVSTSEKEASKEDSVTVKDEEESRQEKDHQNENSIQV